MSCCFDFYATFLCNNKFTLHKLPEVELSDVVYKQQEIIGTLYCQIYKQDQKSSFVKLPSDGSFHFMHVGLYLWAVLVIKFNKVTTFFSYCHAALGRSYRAYVHKYKV